MVVSSASGLIIREYRR